MSIDMLNRVVLVLKVIFLKCSELCLIVIYCKFKRFSSDNLIILSAVIKSFSFVNIRVLCCVFSRILDLKELNSFHVNGLMKFVTHANDSHGSKAFSGVCVCVCVCLSAR